MRKNRIAGPTVGLQHYNRLFATSQHDTQNVRRATDALWGARENRTFHSICQSTICTPASASRVWYPTARKGLPVPCGSHLCADWTLITRCAVSRVPGIRSTSHWHSPLFPPFFASHASTSGEKRAKNQSLVVSDEKHCAEREFDRLCARQSQE